MTVAELLLNILAAFLLGFTFVYFPLTLGIFIYKGIRYNGDDKWNTKKR